jgi:hypothetical protein
MFADAIEWALSYTAPAILSRKAINGDCSAAIGAFVIVNSDGWIVTAAHLLQQMEQLLKDLAQVQAIQAQKSAIENDASLSGGERRKRIALLPKLNPKATERGSTLWAKSGVSITDVSYIAGVDIGVGKLIGFTPAPNQRYPKFKDPTKGFRLGTSLCRLGFPFHQVRPTWDAQHNTFRLPPEAYPVPVFASEGIVSRFMNINIPSQPLPPPFPMMWLETSSPGLKGQSGGPLVDSRGSIWGIQSNTISYSLGFDPVIKKDGKDQSEHQFLNVGRAVHAETILGLFRQLNINHELSDY